MADEQEQILNIRVNYSDAVRGIEEYKQKIAECNAQLEKLDEAQEQGTISAKEYAEGVAIAKNQINVYNGEIRTLNKEIQNNIKVQEAQDGSLKQLRAQLSNLTKEYDSLSKSERESGQRGKELREAINATTSQIKEAEEATQRYYRNVGNYENAIKNTLGTQSKWFQQLQMIRDAMSGGVANGIKMAGAAVADFGKQLLALLVNPIVAAIAGIAVAFKLVSDAIKNNEENMDRWKTVTAPIGRIFELLSNTMQQLAARILYVVEAGGAMLGWISRMLEKVPLLGDAMRDLNDELAESVAMEKEAQAIRNDRRKEEVADAKASLEAQRLLTKAYDKVNYTAKERLAFLREATKIEQARADDAEKLAARELKLANQRASISKNNSKTNDELAAKEAAYYQAQQQREALQTSLKQRESRLLAQIAAEEKKGEAAAKSRGDAAEKASQKAIAEREREIKAIRESENALVALIKDTRERERETLRLQYDRQIEDLKKALSTEKNLTERAREEINTTIISLVQQRNIKIAELDAQASREAIEKAVKAEEERLQLIIETTRKGSEEQFNARMALLQQQQDAATMEIEQSELTEEQKQERLSLIAKSYEQQRTQLRIAANQEELAALQKDFEERIAQESDNAVAQQELRVEQKRQELEALHQVEGESEQEFAQRKLEIQKQYNEENKKLVEQNNKVEQSRLQVAQAVFGGLTSIMDAFGDDNKAAAVASKVLALAEVAINTGKAISAGVASAMATPFPGNIAAVATTIATVMANITTAIKTINSAKFADGGVAEGGGNVSGTGTSKSDSIAAQLSNGESVMTAAATAMFAPMLSTMNQIGGGVPIQPTATIYTSQSGEGDGMEMMASALANAIREMPAPIVSVEEINDVSTRVNVIESMAEAPVTQ